ncbi:MAG: ATP-binding protein [Planctomycetota bacterium]|nr:ATP-binding protein [Planctomycetota bacterium]
MTTEPGATLDHLRCTFPAQPRYLPLVRGMVSEAAGLAGYDQDLTTRILLAVTEAVTNVIRHAYNHAVDKPIDLELRVDGDCLRLDLIDYGRFIDPKHIASRPLDQVRPGGLGVHLIKTTMDHVEYRENAHGGTTLTMVKQGS